jgi:hypothetical protein
MARKPNPKRVEVLNEKDDLEKLINGDDNLVSSLKLAESILPERPTVGFLNYMSVKDLADNEAEKIVDSIAEFYLDRDIIAEVAYIREKNTVDKLTVSSLLFQMKTAEHAIIKLLEEIDNGGVHPRAFEVLSSLQKAKMDIVKHMAQFMVIMENNYKSLKEDYRIKKAEGPQELKSGEYEVEEAAGNQIRGTRKLIETLRQAIPEHKAEGSIKKDIDNVE